MRLGLVELRLAPEVFWGLTPAELMLMAGFDDAPAALGRSGLEALLARFPDPPRPERNEEEKHV
jgi:uncharacterized phage protein (TIGR02216 family)